MGGGGPLGHKINLEKKKENFQILLVKNQQRLDWYLPLSKEMSHFSTIDTLDLIYLVNMISQSANSKDSYGRVKGKSII